MCLSLWFASPKKLGKQNFLNSSWFHILSDYEDSLLDTVCLQDRQGDQTVSFQKEEEIFIFI